ncbi:amidohydrolase, partial [Bacillus paranthracis]|nr:amidohydrolase [Bacillus paranthracis]
IAHTHVFRESARSELVDKALLTSAKALANTEYRLITEEGLLEKMKEENRKAKRIQCEEIERSG